MAIPFHCACRRLETSGPCAGVIKRQTACSCLLRFSDDSASPEHCPVADDAGSVGSLLPNCGPRPVTVHKFFPTVPAWIDRQTLMLSYEIEKLSCTF